MNNLLNNILNDFPTQFAIILVAFVVLNFIFKKELKKEKIEDVSNAWDENAKLVKALEAKKESEKFSTIAQNKELLNKYKTGQPIKIYGITFFTLSGNFRLDIDVTIDNAEEVRDAFHNELFIAFSDGKERFTPSIELTDEYPDCPCVNLSHVVTFLPSESFF